MKNQKQIALTVGLAVLGAMNTSFFGTTTSHLVATQTVGTVTLASGSDDKVKIQTVGTGNTALELEVQKDSDRTEYVLKDNKLEKVEKTVVKVRYKVAKPDTEGRVCLDCTDYKTEVLPISVDKIKSLAEMSTEVVKQLSDAVQKANLADEKKAKDKTDLAAQEALKKKYATCDDFPADVLEEFDGNKDKAETKCLSDKMKEARRKHDNTAYEKYFDRLHDKIEDLMDDPKDRESIALAKDLVKLSGDKALKDTFEGFNRILAMDKKMSSFDRTMESLSREMDRIDTAQANCNSYDLNCSFTMEQRRNQVQARAQQIQNQMVASSPYTLRPLQYKSGRFGGGLLADDISKAYDTYEATDDFMTSNFGVKSMLSENDYRFLSELDNDGFDAVSRRQYSSVDRNGMSTPLLGSNVNTASSRLLRGGTTGYNHANPSTLLSPRSTVANPNMRYNAGGYQQGSNYTSGYPATGSPFVNQTNPGFANNGRTGVPRTF